MFHDSYTFYFWTVRIKNICNVLWVSGGESAVIVLCSNIVTGRKRSLRRLCFYRCLSVHTGGTCVVAAGGHTWLLPGGMVALGGMRVALGGVHGCSGRGACVVALGGMHGCSGGGHVWLLPGWACMVAPRGACMGYDEIRRYDQWAGGTHPTGMHSCYHLLLFLYLFQLAKWFSFTWTFGEFLCKGVHYMQNVSVICSITTLTAISLER